MLLIRVWKWCISIHLACCILSILTVYHQDCAFLLPFRMGNNPIFLPLFLQDVCFCFGNYSHSLTQLVPCLNRLYVLPLTMHLRDIVLIFICRRCVSKVICLTIHQMGALWLGPDCKYPVWTCVKACWGLIRAASMYCTHQIFWYAHISVPYCRGWVWTWLRGNMTLKMDFLHSLCVAWRNQRFTELNPCALHGIL